MKANAKRLSDESVPKLIYDEFKDSDEYKFFWDSRKSLYRELHQSSLQDTSIQIIIMEENPSSVLPSYRWFF